MAGASDLGEWSDRMAESAGAREARHVKEGRRVRRGRGRSKAEEVGQRGASSQGGRNGGRNVVTVLVN